MSFSWGAVRDLNPQPPESQSGAPPIELTTTLSCQGSNLNSSGPKPDVLPITLQDKIDPPAGFKPATGSLQVSCSIN